MHFIYFFVDWLLSSIIFYEIAIPVDVYQWYVVGITLFICALIVYLPVLSVYNFVKRIDRGIL